MAIITECFFLKLSGGSCGKPKSIDRQKRSIKHSTRDSGEIGGPSEGRWPVHCTHFVLSDDFFSLILAFTFFSLIFSFQVVANMRGNSAEEVAERVLSQPSLSGLQVMFQNGGEF